jgi:hypothetical protein
LDSRGHVFACEVCEELVELRNNELIRQTRENGTSVHFGITRSFVKEVLTFSEKFYRERADYAGFLHVSLGLLECFGARMMGRTGLDLGPRYPDPHLP